jgi:integrase/recombinase XerD
MGIGQLLRHRTATPTYLHARLALQEKALAKLKPYEKGKRTHFRPNDRLPAFLEAL